MATTRLRPMSMGEILDASFALLRHHAGVFFGIAIVCQGVPTALSLYDQFAGGTRTIAHAIANSKAFSIAGGGDTLAAIGKFGIADRISYISTGGGAFLEFLEGQTLPAVEILEQRAG